MRPIVALLGVTVAGCGPTVVDTYKFTIRQAALLPAPTGPHAMGPLLRRRELAVEGGLSLAPASGGNGSTSASSVSSTAPGNSRDDGAPGEVLAATVLRARLSYGFRDWLEGGLEVEYANPSFGSPLASDITSSSLNGASFWRMGAQLRGIVFGNQRLGVGFNAELALGLIPYARAIDSGVSMSCYDPSCGASPTVTSSTGSTNDIAPAPFARVGAFVTGQPLSHLTLFAGVLIQDQPFFFGTGSYNGTCSFYPGGGWLAGTSCMGVSDPSQVNSFAFDVLATAWASMSLSIGRVTLTGQFFGHFAGLARTIDPAPIGGAFGARVNVL